MSDDPFDAFLASAAAAEVRAEIPVTAKEIASLGDDELDDRIWRRLVTVVGYRDAALLGLADPVVSAYVATRAFENEVGNGGLHQFFFNFRDPRAFWSW